jgi:hypothetical protein
MCIAHNQLVSVLGPTFIKNSDSFAINTDLAILAYIAETGAHIRGVWGCYTPIILRNVQKVAPCKRTILSVPIVQYINITQTGCFHSVSK